MPRRPARGAGRIARRRPPGVERLDARRPRATARADLFEVTTAMGLLHFARCGVDLAVVEVGMGGRLDSTNVIRPLVSVITSISFDHTRQLGNDRGDRRREGRHHQARPADRQRRGPGTAEVVRAVAHARRCRIVSLKRFRQLRTVTADQYGRIRDGSPFGHGGATSPTRIAAAGSPPGPQRGRRPGNARRPHKRDRHPAQTRSRRASPR